MIDTKFCDVCDTELPPLCFQHSYECADIALHKKHPNENFTAIRISASPLFTNGDSSQRPDICPACFLNLCKLLVKRLERRNKKENSTIENWKAWRVASRKNEITRQGANDKKEKL